MQNGEVQSIRCSKQLHFSSSREQGNRLNKLYLWLLPAWICHFCSWSNVASFIQSWLFLPPLLSLLCSHTKELADPIHQGHSPGGRHRSGGLCYEGLDHLLSCENQSHLPHLGRIQGLKSMMLCVGRLPFSSYTHCCGRAGALFGNCTGQHTRLPVFLFLLF